MKKIIATSQKSLWQKFNKVVFDCDSTLTKIEGIDELARLKNKYRQVKNLTKKAMDGDIALEEVFAERLGIIKPTKKDLIKLGKLYLENLTKGVREVLEVLKFLNIDIYIVTGGLKIPVEFLATNLGLDKKKIFANELFFTKNGAYQGFDENNPLFTDSGKKKTVRLIKKNKDKVVLVGDGMTDYDTNGGVDLFVGYGGVVKRKQVQKLAPIYIKCEDLSALLIIIAGKEGCEKLMTTKHEDLLQKGFTYIFHKKQVLFKGKYKNLKTEIRNYFLKERFP